MKKSDVIFSRKEFLNLDGMENMANIVAHITLYNWKNEVIELKNREIDIHLSIADCERKINLSLDLGTEYERENSLHKVETLISVLTDFREAIISESAIQAEREKLIQESKEN